MCVCVRERERERERERDAYLLIFLSKDNDIIFHYVGFSKHHPFNYLQLSLQVVPGLPYTNTLINKINKYELVIDFQNKRRSSEIGKIRNENCLRKPKYFHTLQLA